MPRPEAQLSIIVPSCGRFQLVEALLASIAADAKGRPFPIQVILVDGSKGREAEALCRLATLYNATYIGGAPPHAGISRNIGVAEAHAPFLLFLDSDVTVCPGALQAHYDAMSSGAEACAGVVQFAGPRTFAWRSVECMQLMLPFRYPQLAASVPWAPTANISFRKDRFLAVAGFDPALPAYGGEDVDFGFRFSNAGFRIQTSAEAVVQHTTATWSRWSQNVARLSSYGKADFYLMERHPDRTYADLPSPLLVFVGELLLAVLIAPVLRFYALGPLALGLLAQFFGYALLKRRAGDTLLAHLPGPFILALLDFGKWVEAFKHGQLRPIFLRLRYLDDIIQKDWREIWAYTWSGYASIVTFSLATIGLFFVYNKSA